MLLRPSTHKPVSTDAPFAALDCWPASFVLEKLLFRSTCTVCRVGSCCRVAAAAAATALPLVVVVVPAGLEGSQLWSDDVSVLQDAASTSGKKQQ